MKPRLTKDLLEFYNKRLGSSRRFLEKLIFITSVITSAFLLFSYLNYKVFQLDSVVIGFFHELLIIPCIFSQPVLLFLALQRYYKKKYAVKMYAYVSVTILLISQILVWSSLFVPND